VAPRLQEITLIHATAHHLALFESFTDSLMQCARSLLQLSTLALEGYPSWRNLLLLLARFNKPAGGGITTVRIPGLPHPLILWLLVDVLKKGHEEDFAIESLG
jgi:hypothetical protein